MHAPPASLVVALGPLLLAASLLSAAPAAAVRVLVGEVKVDRPADAAVATALTRVIESEVIQAAPDVDVMTWRAVAATLETAEVADCLGDAQTAACASEIGGALGVDLIVSPHLSSLGSVRVLTVSVYRMGDATVAGQATRRVPKDDDDGLFDAAASAVDEALVAADLRVVARERAESLHAVRPDDDVRGSPSALPWVVAGAGVSTGALLALAGGALHAGVLLAWSGPYERGELDLEKARAWENGAALWLTLPWLAYAGGAALFAGGVVGGWVMHE